MSDPLYGKQTPEERAKIFQGIAESMDVQEILELLLTVSWIWEKEVEEFRSLSLDDVHGMFALLQEVRP